MVPVRFCQSLTAHGRRCLGLLLLYGVAGLPGRADAVPINMPEKSPAPASETHVRQGLDYLESGAVEEAGIAFRESLEQEPRHVGALLGLAEVAGKQGHPQEARAHLQQALQATPNSLPVRIAWARFLVMQHQLKEADQAYRAALTLAPSPILLRLEHARFLLLTRNDAKGAMLAYRAAIAQAPENAAAHYGYAQALARTGATDHARAEWAEAALLAPSDPWPLYALGSFHAIQREYAQALAAFTASIKAQSGFVPGHLARGDTLIHLGRVDEAVVAFREAAEFAPKMETAHLCLGGAYEQLRHWDEAEQSYRKALEVAPKNPAIHNNLAWLAATRKIHLDEALAWATQAVELAPNVPQFEDTLGWVHYIRGELPQAFAALTNAARHKPARPLVLYHLGIVQIERGERTAGLALLKQALALDQTFQEAEDATARVASGTVAGTHSPRK